jgi:hypothetical protein
VLPGDDRGGCGQHHVRRSLSLSPFTTTLERSESTLDWNWDIDIDYAPRV